MLLGLFSDIKGRVQNSLDEVHRCCDWDFDTEGNKEERIKDIFYQLGWDRLYRRSAWWDVTGLDRKVRIARVKEAIREVLTKKKFACIPAVENLFATCKSLDEVKGEFSFFKRKELAALQTQPRHPLHDAKASNWKSLLRKPQRDCRDPKSWEKIMALPKSEIDRALFIIQSGLNTSAILKNKRQTLLHIARLYSDPALQNRDPLPGRMRRLFAACDHSGMILFAFPKYTRNSLSEIQGVLNDEHIQELQAYTNGTVVEPQRLGGKGILKKLWLLDDSHFLFSNRTFTLVKHERGKTTSIPIANDLRSLSAALSRLSGAQDESFNRVVETLLLEEALIPAGTRTGGLIWQMHELTAPILGEDRVISQKSGSDLWRTEIHDFGNGKVQVIHSVAAEVQQNPCGIPGPHLGTLQTRFSYSVEKGQAKGNYHVGPLSLNAPHFEWDSKRNAPFTTLTGWPDLSRALINRTQQLNQQFQMGCFQKAVHQRRIS